MTRVAGDDNIPITVTQVTQVFSSKRVKEKVTPDIVYLATI